jgi:hypothetical protein
MRRGFVADFSGSTVSKDEMQQMVEIMRRPSTIPLTPFGQARKASHERKLPKWRRALLWLKAI